MSIISSIRKNSTDTFSNDENLRENWNSRSVFLRDCSFWIRFHLFAKKTHEILNNRWNFWTNEDCVVEKKEDEQYAVHAQMHRERHAMCDRRSPTVRFNNPTFCQLATLKEVTEEEKEKEVEVKRRARDDAYVRNYAHQDVRCAYVQFHVEHFTNRRMSQGEVFFKLDNNR